MYHSFFFSGTLLNSSVSDIIDAVLSISEFSADDCECLEHVLAEIVERSPVLFRDLANPPTKHGEKPTNPHILLQEYVSNWMKFRELIFLLTAGLQDVADRWADGKGMLALYFSAEEVRKITVAIFENTSRRDAILSQLR